ncbi:LysR family transcriptional regulator [Ferrimonas sp. YFM]|uniref:LysR family transcriptional regulator n=1 Tax=Ferrimonas sp. YFM TaxID=3028878 RepID=UPI002572881D|nr:LysR family transcriptional regulator [Ferrimonas sp. YFM]BDY05636.1 transcriptional regulator [Ferrimonas sp. YFM]
MDHLRQMMLFRTLVDKGSFTSASEALGLSKSVLSQHLKSLEGALGTQLLQRTTRSQVLTPTGREFYRQCCDIGDRVSLAWDRARESSGTLGGSIRISLPHALMEPVSAALASLVSAHPEIEPELVTQDTQVDLVAEGVDLAIRVGKVPSSSLKQRRIGQFRETLVMAQNCSRQEHYVANSWEASQVVSHLTGPEGKQRQLSFVPKVRANDLPSVLALVRTGLGVARVPTFLLEREASLTPLLPGYTTEPVGVFAVHSYQQPPALVRAVTEAVAEKLFEKPAS